MATQTDGTTIVRKRIKKAGDGHHGGAWKVAYADFVTAMMAFFLLMWLLNATTEQQRKGLADFFDPSVPISRVSAGGTGVLNGESVTDRDRLAGSEPGRPRSDRAPREGAPDPEELARKAEEAGLESLARQIERAMTADGAAFAEHFMVHLTPEGLVIEIADARDAPLFAAGSDRPGPRLTRLIGVLVPVLERATNRVKVAGHADATGGRGFDNWALSAARANAARRLMEAAGLAPERVSAVSGHGATRPLLPDPAAPQNRRISVTLLREAAR